LKTLRNTPAPAPDFRSHYLGIVWPKAKHHRLMSTFVLGVFSIKPVTVCAAWVDDMWVILKPPPTVSRLTKEDRETEMVPKGVFVHEAASGSSLSQPPFIQISLLNLTLEKGEFVSLK
jgi:hypothetical protein